MTKWIKEKLKRVWKLIIFHCDPRRIDQTWYEFGGSSYELFPPSFYYTHTEEEIKRISKKEIDKLKAFLEDFEKQHEKENEAP